MSDCGVKAIEASYADDKTDEFVIPAVICENGQPLATVKDKDSVIFFNFRPDRAREITRAFCADDFDGFEREKRLDLTFVCFTEYDVTIPNKDVAFHKVSITNTFGEFLAAPYKMTQARMRRTRKYAHVTFSSTAVLKNPMKVRTESL